MIQISDIFGAYGVSFMIMQANSACFVVYRHLVGCRGDIGTVSRRVAVASSSAVAAALILVWVYGMWRINGFERLIDASPAEPVSIVQGNIDQDVKWDPAFQTDTTRKYLALSRRVGKEPSNLVVWPETATPFAYGYHPRLTGLVRRGIIDIGRNFLFGSLSFRLADGRVEHYNSAYLIDRTGTAVDRYDKAHLVPFGEYVPLGKWFPFLGKIVAQVGDFTPGERGKTIRWGKYRLGVLICYEGIFPDLARHMVRNGSSCLVNITNDAWYGRTSAPYQHFSIAVFRAIENRRSLVRSANTGISGFVDPVGRILASTDLFVDDVLTRRVPLIDGITLYTRFGDMLPKACLAVMLVLCGRLILRRKTR